MADGLTDDQAFFSRRCLGVGIRTHTFVYWVFLHAKITHFNLRDMCIRSFTDSQAEQTVKEIINALRAKRLEDLDIGDCYDA